MDGEASWKEPSPVGHRPRWLCLKRAAETEAETERTHGLRDFHQRMEASGQEIWLHNCRDRGDQASVFAGRAIDPPDPKDPGQGQ